MIPCKDCLTLVICKGLSFMTIMNRCVLIREHLYRDGISHYSKRKPKFIHGIKQMDKILLTSFKGDLMRLV